MYIILLLFCLLVTAAEDNLQELVDRNIAQHLVLVLSQYEGQDIQMAALKLLALILSQGNLCTL